MSRNTNSTNATQSISTNQETILRRIGEDPILRPFLSSLFDNETYIKHIIQENKSEECFSVISNSTEMINEEIQRFITENRDLLMSGMQDVASLANQYQTLAERAKILQSTVGRLKKEVSESYDVVNLKTQELERIHETNFILNQFRQFVKAKSQLEQYLKNEDDKDTRSLANAARTIAELEKLLSNPKLLEIKFVNNSVNEIKTFGNNIRLLSQTNLFQAIEEKNQLEISNYMQVFYNLEILPEINLLIIDHLVKKTIESSQALLNFQQLQLLYNDYINKGSGSLGSSNASNSNLSASASKRNLLSTSTSNLSSVGNAGNNGNVTISQLRIAMRELSHIWSSMIYDKATQVVVFQRVLWKKEDPISHEKFLNVLKQKVTSGTFRGKSNANNNDLAYSYLSNGQLLSLFWHRLSQSLQDICVEKIRENPTITSRSYLCLRKALAEILTTIQHWNEEELQRNLGPGMKFMKALVRSSEIDVFRPSYSLSSTTGDFFLAESVASGQNVKNSSTESESDEFVKNFKQLEDICGYYGSLLWNHNDILNSSFISQQLPSSRRKQSNSLNPFNRRQITASVRDGRRKSITENNEGNVNAVGNNPQLTEHPLINGLKPFHDRYMLSVLERMNVPITQMFPELDGYVAAIPSKRDLQTFIKAIQNEFITVIVESDEKIIYSICKEFLKVNKLMLSKIINMIYNNQDSRRINSSASTSSNSTTNSTIPTLQLNQNITFQRNQNQEHNLQLFILLLQLKESIEKIPTQIIKYLDENALLSTLIPSNSSNSTSFSTGNNKSTESNNPSSSAHHGGDLSLNHFIQHSLMLNEIHKTITLAIYQIYECIIQHLLSQVIDMVTDYSINLLLPLQKESILYLNPNNKLPVPAAASSLECSITIQNFVKQFPNLIKTYLFNLPKSQQPPTAASSSSSSSALFSSQNMILELAMEEIAMRIIQAYLSIASLSKPFNELIKMKIAKDLSSLEELLSTFCNFNSFNLQHSPVLEEYRSFRRYLFEEHEGGVLQNKEKATLSTVPYVSPKMQRLQVLDYVSFLRPSVLIGYLMATAPTQLPLPFEMLEKPDFASYLHQILLNYQPDSKASNNPTDVMKVIEGELTHFYNHYGEMTAVDQNNHSSNNNSSPHPTSIDRNHSIEKEKKHKEETFYFQLATRLFQSNIPTVNALYIKDMNKPAPTTSSTTSSTSSNSFSLSMNLASSSAYLWKQNLNEKQNWELIQKSLDLFFQRITVIENPEQKQLLRHWYETILDIGSQYFS